MSFIARSAPHIQVSGVFIRFLSDIGLTFGFVVKPISLKNWVDSYKIALGGALHGYHRVTFAASP